MEEKVGWKNAKVGEIADLLRGITYKKEQASKALREGYKPILRANNINDSLNFQDLVYVPMNLIKEEQLVKKGDIIFAMSSGSKHLVGKSVQAKNDFQGSCGAFCALLRPNDNISKEFLAYIFQGMEFRKLISKISKGTNINNLKREHILDYNFPLPPLPEQRAIVSKIEQLFSELDNGIANLRLAQEQLKVYRQAVLKKAFEGELTRKWREKNTDVEDSECILNRIKNQVSSQSQNRKNSKIQYDEALYESPLKWNWVSLSDVAISITDGDHQAPPKSESGIPFIVISNISSGKIDLSNTMYVPEEYYNKISSNRKPQPRDILYSVTGSYGIPVLISEDYKFCFQRHIALIRPHTEISSKYIYYFLKSTMAYKQATNVATGTAQLTVPISGLRIIKVPLPPLPEQHAIVREIETRLSVCDKMAQDIDEALEKAEALRQSILKKAFEGKLLNERELAEVRMAEDWEPAEVLLERGREERTGNGKR